MDLQLDDLFPFWGATVLYGVALVLYAAWFRLGDARVGRLASLSMLLAVISKSMGLTLVGLERQVFPPVTTGETLSMVAAATALIYLYLEWRGHDRGLGLFAAVIVFLISLKASLIGPAVEIEQVLRDHFFGPHALAVILALSGFTISAFLSVAYLLQYRQLRGRRLGLVVERLPSLEALDFMTRRSTRVGFFFLTVGLLLGILLAHAAWKEENWTEDPQPWIAIGTWVLYAAALLLRRYRSWQGDRVAIANLVAFLSVVLSALLAYGVLDTAHRFGVSAS